jgi:hypothetical protein
VLRFRVGYLLEARAACALHDVRAQGRRIEMRSIVFAGAVAALTAFAGCTVRGRGAAYEEPVGTTYVTSAPVDNYQAYPHTDYEGRTVYYVQGRWGYPHQGRWVYYRNEPPGLARYRNEQREAPRGHRDERPPYHHQEYLPPDPNPVRPR